MNMNLTQMGVSKLDSEKISTIKKKGVPSKLFPFPHKEKGVASACACILNARIFRLNILY